MIVLLAWPGLVYNTDCCEYFMAKYFSRSNIFTFPANILHVSRQFNSIQLYRHCNVHDIFSIQHTSAQHSPLHIKFYIPLWLPHHTSTPHHSSATLLTHHHIEYTQCRFRPFVVLFGTKIPSVSQLAGSEVAASSRHRTPNQYKRHLKESLKTCFFLQ